MFGLVGLVALTAVTSCRQHWQLLQAVASIGSCYKLSPALTVFISCCQLWLVFYVGASFDSCYKTLRALTAVTSSYKLLNIWFHHLESIHCRQLWQLLQLLPALPALPVVTSCWQLNLNFILMSTLLRYLIPSARVNSLNLQQGRDSVSEWVSESVSHWLG